MTIEIHRPELEALLRERTSTGAFRDVEDVILQALTNSTLPSPRLPEDRKSLAQLFANSPFKGLDIEFERDPDLGRDVAL